MKKLKSTFITYDRDRRKGGGWRIYKMKPVINDLGMKVWRTVRCLSFHHTKADLFAEINKLIGDGDTMCLPRLKHGNVLSPLERAFVNTAHMVREKISTLGVKQ